MSLSDIRLIETKMQPVCESFPVALGAIEIFEGALLNFSATGFLELGADTASELFAGIAFTSLSQAAGGADGDNSMRVYTAGSGIWVKLPVNSALTEASKGLAVYVVDDDTVDLVGVTVNDVLVGTIKQIVDANTAWVQI